MMKENNQLADLLFPNVTETTTSWERKYLARNLSKGAMVTRTAPSPTGYMHVGGLFGALADERLAHQSGGVFYLRIEDTDNKRKVDGATDIIVESLKYFGITPDEGAENGGDYGTYYQSERGNIYQTYAKHLVSKGLAYPCFCTEEDLTEIRNEQTKDKVSDIGYYGKYAKCRELSFDEVKSNLDAGKPFVIRLKSDGRQGKSIWLSDEIKGKIKMPENIMDIVLLKSDGIPTYHFAHAIDDHLMRTTLVLRGEEWLPSYPVHKQLFEVLGFREPRYAHTACIMKDDNGGRRKLSKRKDPEASCTFYMEKGYLPKAVKIYLLTLLNSNFEEWCAKHPDSDINDFNFSLNKMSQSGCLFDMEKLHNICKNEFTKMSVDEVYSFLYEYTSKYQPEKFDDMFKDPNKMKRVLALHMGINAKRRRKDFIYAEQILDEIEYYFEPAKELEFKLTEDLTKSIINDYKVEFDPSDDCNTWFEKLQSIASKYGFAVNNKAFKETPSSYKGTVADIAETVRMKLTGRVSGVDLWEINQILGAGEVSSRLS